MEVSYRVIAYYEGETKYPPALLVVPLASAIGITTDKLSRAKDIKQDFDTRNTALRRKLKTVEELPKKEQKAILHYIDLIVKNRGTTHKAAQK